MAPSPTNARPVNRNQVPAPGDLVPSAVLEGHADDEDHELELGSRDPEAELGSGSGDVRAFDREPVVLRPIVAEDELIVSMHVD